MRFLGRTIRNDGVDFNVKLLVPAVSDINFLLNIDDVFYIDVGVLVGLDATSV